MSKTSILMESLTKIDNCAPYKTHENGKMWQRFVKTSGGCRGSSGNSPCQTGEPWHLLCHGGKTPAKPHVPRVPCAHSAQ